MQIQSVVNAVEMNVTNTINRMTMNTEDSFIFETLIQFYKQPINSIGRELCSNAIDTHVIAGKQDVPFEVHLPTYLEPNFSVTDFGTGIDPDKFEEIYCCFGASNKRTSNETIGGFGLGSKTPYAYSGNYMVINRFNGIAYTYSFFRDEENFPDYVLLGQAETDESNGMTLQFSVAEKDFDAFKHSVFNACKYLTVKPVTNLEMHWDTSPFSLNKLFEQPEWFVLNADLSYYQKNFVILGVIEYPVEASDILDAMSNESYDKLTTQKVKDVLNLGVYLKFNIGELRPIPSRESLLWNSSNTHKVVDRLITVHDFISAHLKQELESGITDFELALKVVQYFNHAVHKKATELKTIYAHVCGINLHKGNMYEIALTHQHYGLFNCSSSKDMLKKIKKEGFKNYGLLLNLTEISDTKPMIVAVSSGRLGYKAYLKDEGDQFDKVMLVNKKETAAAMLALETALKNEGAESYVKVVNMDELQPKIAGYGGGGGRVAGKVKVPMTSLHRIFRTKRVCNLHVDPDYVELDDVVFYVKRDRTELLHNFGSSCLEHMQQYLNLEELDDEPIAVLSETEYCKLKDKVQLISLKEYLSQKMSALEFEYQVIAQKQGRVIHNNTLLHILNNSDALEVYMTQLTDDSRFKQLLKQVQEEVEYESNKVSIDEVQKLKLYSSWFGLTVPRNSFYRDKKEESYALKYYPLLVKYFSNCYAFTENNMEKSLVLYYIKNRDLELRHELFKVS